MPTCVIKLQERDVVYDISKWISLYSQEHLAELGDEHTLENVGLGNYSDAFKT